MAKELITIRVAVACYGGAGPLLVPVKVECQDADVQDGSHYVAAEANVKTRKFGAPMVAFDEKDHTGKVICGCISDETWAECPTVTV